MKPTVSVLCLRPFRVRDRVFGPGDVADLAPLDAAAVLAPGRAELVDQADMQIVRAAVTESNRRALAAHGRESIGPRARWPA